MALAERIWSAQQTAIFERFAREVGHLVIRARAGTGKTTTIIEAILHAPKHFKILVCAFNTRIKRELVRRVEALQAKGLAKNVEVKSLHGLGNGFLYAPWGRTTPEYSDEVDRDRARDAAGHNAPDDVVVAVKKLASLIKNMAPLAGPEDLTQLVGIAQQFDCSASDESIEAGWDLTRIVKAAGKACDLATVRDAAGRISFDDQVFVPLAMDFARPRYDLVVVDEAQDMNAAQLLLAQRVCKKSGRIVVVGDDRQAIYGFRGADAGSIDRLKAELQAEELGLTVTYRCGKKIVDLARQLVSDFSAYDGNADGIIDTIGQNAIFEQAKPGDFVLSRKNAPLMGLALGFLKRGIRARIEGRDIGKMLRGIINSFKAKSVPNYLERVQAWGQKATKRAGKITRDEVRQTKLDEIQDQVAVLCVIAEGCANVAAILARCESLFGDADEQGRKPEVVLSSVHKAKGLESERVFILQSTVSTRTDEEANIYYVAVTRAIKHLTWVVGEGV